MTLLLTFAFVLAARLLPGRRPTTILRHTAIGPHPFSADRPISDPNEDRLGRNRFAESVAEAINGWQGRDSLVLGLYGQWGSGKTSLLNLIEARLSTTHANVTVVNFNPWEWIDHRELAAAFFGELASAAGGGRNPILATRLAANLESYASFLTIGADTMKSVRTLHGLLMGAILAGLGLTLADGTLKMIGYFLTGIAALATILTLLSSTLSRLAVQLVRRAQPDFAALHQWKQRLRDELEQSAETYLVVIDDLDRLAPTDILRVFQLVKANADFPNLVYLLPFESGVIAEAIHSVNHVNGRDFLEKIVQIGFNIPYPGRSQIEELLFKDIDRALEAAGDAIRQFQTSQSTWTELYQAGIAGYIQTPRDVRRYVASLSFTLSLLTVDNALEVDPVDLIAIEMLRMFEPDLYEAISNARDLLTTARDSVMPGVLATQQARLQRMLTLVPEDRREQAREIVIILFPPAQELLNRPRVAISETWRARRRVCHGEMFERYFRFDLPTGEITRARIGTLLAATTVDEFEREFVLLQEEGLFDSFVKSMRVSADEVPADRREALVSALFVVGEKLDGQSSGFLSVSDALSTSFLVLDVLDAVPTPDERVTLLRRAIDAAAAKEAVYLAAYVVGLLDQREERIPDAVVSAVSLDELNTLVAGKLAASAAAGTLLRSPHLGQLLYWWANWDRPAATQWLHESIGSASGLVAIVAALESSYRTSTDGGTEEHRYFPFDQFADLIPIDELVERASTVRNETAAANEPIEPAVERFLTAIEQHRAGTYHDPRHPF